MPSTSDLPWQGKGASTKTRSRWSRTDCGHLCICVFSISPLVRNPWRHNNLGFLLSSLPIFFSFFFFLFTNPNGITEFKDWTELNTRVRWAQENMFESIFLYLVVAETPIYSLISSYSFLRLFNFNSTSCGPPPLFFRVDKTMVKTKKLLFFSKI